MYDKQNIAYLESQVGVEKVARVLNLIEKNKKPEHIKEKCEFFKIKKVLDAMETYGENRWWESSNLKTIVTFQLEESILIIPAQKFVSAINTVLGLELTEEELLQRLPEIRKSKIN